MQQQILKFEFYNERLFRFTGDEYRTDFDAGRGGYGKLIAPKIAPNTDENR